MNFKFKKLTCLIAFTAIATISSPGYSCTRIVHLDSLAVMIGRNMDWPYLMEQQFRVYPRGMQRTGMANEGTSLQWTAKYGSMVVTAYKSLTSEGINEKGLSVHLLALQGSDYGARHIKIPGMSVAMWAQYYLDQFATVKEAVQAAYQPGYELEAGILPGIKHPVNLHLAIEDAEGNSAVIEYINGTPHINTTYGNATLTNDPYYELQLENLKKYAGLGGDKPLPGTTYSNDRFVRATFYNQHLPPAKSLNDEVYSILSIMRNAAQPYGVASNERRIYSYTLWHVVGDLTHKVYYYASTSSPNMVSFSLDKFNLAAGAPAMMLDIVAHPELTGDVSNKFNPLA